jgi:outer membrane immunogenic protein
MGPEDGGTFMKKAVGLIGASLLFAGSALAADLDVKAPVYKAPPPVAVVPTWAGWYVGANGGWIGSADGTVTNTGTDTGGAGLGAALAGNAIPGAVSLRYNGFLGGAQVGYNWQTGSWVYGLEADIDGSTAKSSAAAVFAGGGGSVPITTAYSRDLDSLATIRGRVGFTVAPTFLVYATGGLAVGHTNTGTSAVAPADSPPVESEPTTNITLSNIWGGWTAGGGVEWLFAPQWSVKAEYLYVDLGTHINTLTYTYGANSSTLTSTFHDTSNVVRAGVNYHF